MHEETPEIGRLALVSMSLLLLSALLSWATIISYPRADQAATIDARLLQALDDLAPRQVYGLNAADLAWLEINLAMTRPQYTVMPYPGGDAIVAPILTRTAYLNRWLPARQGESFDVVAVAGGWTLLNSPLSEEMRRLPHLATAQVVLRDADGKVTPCEPFRNARFQCGSEGWMHVGPRTQRIGGEEEECIWAHPIEKMTIVITYPDVEAIFDDGKRLHVEMGILDSSIGPGTPVDMKVTHGAREVSHRHPDRRGWTSVAVDGEDDAAPLMLEVSASHAGRRHFCYRLTQR